MRRVRAGDAADAPAWIQEQRVVPTRVLPSGAVVPAYVEAPLRAVPPDHRLLTPAEREAEDVERHLLYARLAERVQRALLPLHDQVLAHRRARGVDEQPIGVTVFEHEAQVRARQAAQ